jgi:branched-chain amino acid aminotransferase
VIVYINGTFCTEDTAHVAVTDRGLTLGDGVFDTLLAVDGVPRDARAHFERLHRHAAVIGLTADTALFAALADRLLQENGFTAGRHAVRTTLTRGPGSRGLALPDPAAPTIIMRAAPVPPAPGPARVVIARTVRRNEGSPLSQIKALGYGDNIAAWREARDAGADDALLLNNAGNLACATASNVFVKIGDAWLTPPLADGAMDGVTRAHVLRDGFAREATVTAKDVERADELLLTNSINGRRAAFILNAGGR